MKSLRTVTRVSLAFLGAAPCFATTGSLFIVRPEGSALRIPAHEIIQLRDNEVAEIERIRDESGPGFRRLVFRASEIDNELKNLNGEESRFISETAAALQADWPEEHRRIYYEWEELSRTTQSLRQEEKLLEAEAERRFHEQEAVREGQRNKAFRRVEEIAGRRAEIGTEITRIATDLIAKLPDLERRVYHYVRTSSAHEVTSYILPREAAEHRSNPRASLFYLVRTAYTFSERGATFPYINADLMNADNSARDRIHALMDEVFALVVERTGLLKMLAEGSPQREDLRSTDHKALLAKISEQGSATGALSGQLEKVRSATGLKLEATRRWKESAAGRRQAALQAEDRMIMVESKGLGRLIVQKLAAYMDSERFNRDGGVRLITNANGEFTVSEDARILICYYRSRYTGDGALGWFNVIEPGKPVDLSPANALNVTDRHPRDFTLRILADAIMNVLTPVD